jgi:hypothetical protein
VSRVLLSTHHWVFWGWVLTSSYCRWYSTFTSQVRGAWILQYVREHRLYVLAVAQLPGRLAWPIYTRDGNLGTGIWYLPGTGMGTIFYPWVPPVPDLNRDGYGTGIFSPAGNLTGTWYFTTDIIVGSEQVKMCSFCYINYDLFWLLNFATRLYQIFVDY